MTDNNCNSGNNNRNMKNMQTETNLQAYYDKYK